MTSTENILDLDSIPKRFWTRQMAEMTRGQHQYVAALRILDFIAEQDSDAHEEVGRLKINIRREAATWKLRQRKEKVVADLKTCLNRARKLRRSRR